MIRTGFRIVTALFAILGLGTVLLILFLISWGWGDVGDVGDSSSTTFAASPSGAFKAVLTTWTGGGAGSSYCNDRLTVVPVGTPPDKASASDMAVFEAECASFALRNDISENSPIVSWEGDDRLKVKFSTTETGLQLATVKLRKQDASGRVAVEFEAQP